MLLGVRRWLTGAGGSFNSYVTAGYTTPPTPTQQRAFDWTASRKPTALPSLCSGGHLTALKQCLASEGPAAPCGGLTADSGKSVFVRRARSAVIVLTPR